MALKINNADVTSNKLNYTDIILETLNSEPVWDKRPPLSPPQGSLTDKFDYDDGTMNWYGGVMLIALHNSNSENVMVRGRILFGSSDGTNNFSHFSEAGGYFFGDTFPANKGLNYGLSVYSGGLWTDDWSYPITVEVWFEPLSGSTKSKSDKLIITVNS